MVCIFEKTTDMITILHNPRCGKSRNAVKFLAHLDIKFDIRNYLLDPLSREEILTLLNKLEMKPIDIVRTKEIIWKQIPEIEKIDDDSIIEILVQYPILIERPIIISKNNAILGRSQENLEKIQL